MSDLELEILKRFVVRYAEAGREDPDRTNKCLRELDLRAVLHDLTGEIGHDLDQAAQIWFQLLAPRRGEGPLRPCSDRRKNQDEHKYHARAYLQGHTPTPAWDRIRELERERPQALETRTMQGPSMSTIRLHLPLI